MRTVLLLAALLLAGCSDNALPDTSPTPSDGDDGNDGSGDGSGNGSGNGAGFAPQTGHDEADDPAAPGLRVVGDMRTCESGFCVNFTAYNEGSATYHASDFCMPPWSDGMERDGEPVQHRRPTAHCAGFGTAPFVPGDELHFEAS